MGHNHNSTVLVNHELCPTAIGKGLMEDVEVKLAFKKRGPQLDRLAVG